MLNTNKNIIIFSRDVGIKKKEILKVEIRYIELKIYQMGIKVEQK